MINNGNLEAFRCPLQGFSVQTLASHEQSVHAGHVVTCQFFEFGVYAANSSECCGGSEERANLVFVHDAPEGTSVRGPDGLTFIDHGGGTSQQGSVNDVGVANHPAHIRRCPHHFTGLDVVDVGHRPRECNGVTAVITHDALGVSGGARGVKNVERISSENRNTVSGCRLRCSVIPVEPGHIIDSVVGLDGSWNVASFLHNDGVYGALGERKCFSNHGQVFHGATGLKTT